MKVSYRGDYRAKIGPEAKRYHPTLAPRPSPSTSLDTVEESIVIGSAVVGLVVAISTALLAGFKE
jgi:hypothetical protein